MVVYILDLTSRQTGAEPSVELSPLHVHIKETMLQDKPFSSFDVLLTVAPAYHVSVLCYSQELHQSNEINAAHRTDVSEDPTNSEN